MIKCFSGALQEYAMQGAGLGREQVHGNPDVCLLQQFMVQSSHSSSNLAGGFCNLSLLISLCASRTFIFLKVKSK